MGGGVRRALDNFPRNKAILQWNIDKLSAPEVSRVNWVPFWIFPVMGYVLYNTPNPFANEYYANRAKGLRIYPQALAQQEVLSYQHHFEQITPKGFRDAALARQLAVQRARRLDADIFKSKKFVDAQRQNPNIWL